MTLVWHSDILHVSVTQEKDDISLILTFELVLKTNNLAVSTIKKSKLKKSLKILKIY